MTRWAHILTTFFALAAWAGAQGPTPAAPLNPADQRRLLKANGTLIDNLVDHGVAMSSPDADRVEVRAEKCRRAAKALASAIQDAAGKQEAERVTELTNLFGNVVRDGLLPTLDDGKRTVTPGSPADVDLRRVRETSAKDVTDLKATIPATAKTKDALKQLDDLAEKIDKLK